MRLKLLWLLEWHSWSARSSNHIHHEVLLALRAFIHDDGTSTICVSSPTVAADPKSQRTGVVQRTHARHIRRPLSIPIHQRVVQHRTGELELPPPPTHLYLHRRRN